MYAPTLQLAAWMLKRKPVDLIVSDPLLPDGSVASLRSVLETMSTPPDLLVTGGINERSVRAFGDAGFRYSEIRRKKADPRPLPSPVRKAPARTEAMHSAIKGLGADIRNDLNNPLQEIVAMIFVARAHGEAAPGVDLALNAIEKAATNMSGVVRGLEDKIRKVVQR